MPASVKLVDLTPRFLTFYEAAQGVDPDRRWELWQEHYRFAAVPPTEEGMKLARRLLDQSWNRYPAVMDLIREGASAFRPDPQAALTEVCRLLEFQGDLAVRLVVFVGNFDNNPFAYTHEGVSVVNFPLEGDPDFREIALPHEFAHVVHERLAEHPGGYLRPVGMLAMMEGIAMHTSRLAALGRPLAAYAEAEPGWYAACLERDQQILTGLRPLLADATQEAMWQVTMGTGTTGLKREVYWAGWRVVGHLLEQGRSLGELARLKEVELPAYVDQVLAELTM